MKTYICNECARKIYAETEPDRCTCGADNFGFEDSLLQMNIRKDKKAIDQWLKDAEAGKQVRIM